MKLITIACMYNEVEKGNLRRCLDNISKFSDEIILWDDGSTDDSVEVAKEYTKHIILGGENDFLNETTHLQKLLEKAVEMKADWIFKIDIDEVLDANGTKNLREFCKKANEEGYCFPEITLWRSDCWARKDYLGSGIFLRLWKNNGKLKFNIAHGLHADLFPQGLSTIGNAPYLVIHYGYATEKAIVDRWKERTIHGVPVEIRRKCLDESELVLEHVPHELFPEGCEPERHTKPKPITYDIVIEEKWK